MRPHTPGDTCQTIARGVGFRFEDVRTLLYHEVRPALFRIQTPPCAPAQAANAQAGVLPSSPMRRKACRLPPPHTHPQGKRREAAGAKGPPVGMPKLEILRVNYRCGSR